MAYTYLFKDKYDNVIYIGYTGQTMAQRMNQHFTKGHLPQSVYEEVAKIEYMKHKTKSDAQVWEVYLINKYKPRYNTLNKKNDMLTIDLGEENWKVYQVLKQQAINQKTHWGCLTWVTIAGLIYAIYQFITM
jgi:excinuclease UvrABC nuclease subunit